MKVTDFRGDSTLEGYVEVRGQINQDGTLLYGTHSRFNDDFNLEQHEEMVDYFQGMCKNLCVA